jgi:hypothetical protein
LRSRYLRQQMPFYKAQFKTNADEDGRMWPLGELPDKSYALAEFNVMARKDLDFTFIFFEGPLRDEPTLEDYFIIEQAQLNGPETCIPLYRKR